MSVTGQCPVIFTSRILGGRWSAKLLHLMMRNETLRYSDLRRGCPPISDRILSKELKELSNWGLISRYDHGTIPPRTEYRLTEAGETLRPLLDMLAAWGREAQHRLVHIDEPMM